MRKLMIAAAMAVVGMSAMSPQGALALDRDLLVAPENKWHQGPTRHWDDTKRGPCQGQSSTCGDPYAYRYIQRAWYPNHNSHYWRPSEEMRNRYRYKFTGPKYRYYPAWGKGAHHESGGHYVKPLK